jgi:hypothetical protein
MLWSKYIYVMGIVVMILIIHNANGLAFKQMIKVISTNV